MTETPSTVHGRLLEAVHISGYSFGRAMSELKWLLAENRWRQVGAGFDDVKAFLSTVDFSVFKINIEERKEFAKLLQDIEVSQRTTAKVLGVSAMTVSNDLRVNKFTPCSEETLNNNGQKEVDVNNFTRSHSPRPQRWTLQTGETEWYTPEVYIESARLVMGGIDLDPASNDAAQRLIRAKEYFTEETNGLTKEWRGRIFLNPPYCYPLIADFVTKLCEEFFAGNVTAAILLTNNCTDTRWWHMAASASTVICFTQGRINFYRTDMDKRQPTQGQTFFYFGTDLPAFATEFSKYGLTIGVYPWLRNEGGGGGVDDLSKSRDLHLERRKVQQALAR